MCTLSWRSAGDRYDVVFSRDEKRARAAAEPPKLQAGSAGLELLAPRDPEGGGSWIATNSAGLTLCLLNDYPSEDSDLASPGRVSRGLLLIRAAGLDSAEAVHAFLRAADLEDYRPFFLVLFARRRPPAVWRWDGAILTEQIGITPPLTTSSYRSRLVVAARRRAYRRLIRPNGAPPTVEALLDYHRRRAPWPASASVAMERPDARTVSLTHVSVLASEATMRYYPGDPARPQRTASVVVRSLPVQAAARPAPPEPPHPAVSRRTFDVAALFEEKNPALHGRLPPGVLPVLERLVGAHRVNAGLFDLKDVGARAFPEACLARLGVTAAVEGLPPPPPSARPIFVANHPLGGLDGIVLLAWLLRSYPKVFVPVNDVLARIPQLAPWFVPVDKFAGRRDGLRALHDTFASDAAILVFPAGRTARMVDGRLQDAPWNRLPVKMALRHRRPVVPVRVDARNSALFYGVAKARQRIGITANLEMFLLVRELLSPACRQIGVRVGEAIPAAAVAALGAGDAARIQALKEICDGLEDALPTPSLEMVA